MQCENGMRTTCEEYFTCCDCGGNDCGCAYCWSCGACEACQGETEETPMAQIVVHLHFGGSYDQRECTLEGDVFTHILNPAFQFKTDDRRIAKVTVFKGSKRWFIQNGTGYGWTYAHEDYDGPEDGRCGQATTIEGCVAEIKEREED
jgi:hypothetical protein